MKANVMVDKAKWSKFIKHFDAMKFNFIYGVLSVTYNCIDSS